MPKVGVPALIDRCPATSGAKREVCHHTEPSLSPNADDDDVILGMRHAAWVPVSGRWRFG